jgi:hypothetical protein
MHVKLNSVPGIVGAQDPRPGKNSWGLSGVAPEASIYMYRVFVSYLAFHNLEHAANLHLQRAELLSDFQDLH